jgi:hypothetical protein
MTLVQVSQVRARKAATSANQTGFSASRKVTVAPDCRRKVPAGVCFKVDRGRSSR